MSAVEPKKTVETQKPAPKTREERGPEQPAEKVDFAKLDLRIEKVEERISPSETNVFDK
jgi:hypothetical protein